MSAARVRIAFVVASVGLCTPLLAAPPTPFFQGFETDTNGWFDGLQGASHYGSITRVSGPLTPFQGSFYAEIAQGIDSSPFTRFGGYSSTFPAQGFDTSLAVYLDPAAMGIGQGFDLSSAASDPAGNHRRDFVFHLGKQSNGSVLVGGSNNSGFATRMDLGSIPNFEVASAGWYIFEHAFRDNGLGVLTVDLNLRDAGGSLLWSTTRSEAGDIIGATVGGSRYGWFTFTSGSYAIDASTLRVIPTPGAVALAGLAGLALLRRRRA